jgi:hypothetical protein
MHRFVKAGLALSVPLALITVTTTAATGRPSRTGSDTAQITLTRWSNHRDFRTGSSDGITLRGNKLVLDRHQQLPTMSYTDPFGDGSARTYEYGSWTSPVVQLRYADDEAISSWNAATPTGTWVETDFRGKHSDGSWTKWYVMGRWTSGMDYADGDIHRTSLDDQGDGDGTVYTDTFSTKTGREPVAFQSRVTLLRPAGTKASPTLDALTTMTSQLQPDYSGTSEFTLGRQVELKVPAYAQNIHAGEYPGFGGGGEVWCSPTSTSMVMRYWGRQHSPSRQDLADIVAPNGDPQVDYAAMHTWDYTYEGTGNWPFNAAYAHTYGLNSFVTRLRSLQEVEHFITAGIPVVVSASWKADQMPEAGYATNGHLLTIVGFTADGDPIINDPASNSNDNVRSVYTRKNFEKVWQESTGGVAYIYYPKWMHLPRHELGLTHNW